jgi:hypothetical protein
VPQQQQSIRHTACPANRVRTPDVPAGMLAAPESPTYLVNKGKRDEASAVATTYFCTGCSAKVLWPVLLACLHARVADLCCQQGQEGSCHSSNKVSDTLPVLQTVLDSCCPCRHACCA